MVPVGLTVSRWPAIRIPGSPCFAWGNFARTQPPNPCRPATSSIVAPMTAISRAARSSMRLTAAASQVGLSLSTQARRPASMVSESKGRWVGFIQGSRFQRDISADGSAGRLRRRIGDGFVKPNLAKQTSSCSPAGGLGPSQGSYQARFHFRRRDSVQPMHRANEAAWLQLSKKYARNRPKCHVSFADACLCWPTMLITLLWTLLATYYVGRHCRQHKKCCDDASKIFLRLSAHELIAVGKQTRNAFTAEKITFPLVV